MNHPEEALIETVDHKAYSLGRKIPEQQVKMGQHVIARLIRNHPTPEEHADDLRMAIDRIEIKKRTFLDWLFKPKSEVKQVIMWPLTEANEIEVNAEPLKLAIRPNGQLYEPPSRFGSLAGMMGGIASKEVQHAIQYGEELGYLHEKLDRQHESELISVDLTYHNWPLPA